MAEEKRKTGIDIIGDAPWGTHFCQFYKTKQDLLDILVPYFKAGLENNEFCMWICWDPLRSEEAKEALKESAKDLNGYIARGQIEVMDYSRKQTEKEGSSFNKMKQFWIDKEKLALERGFDGLRLAGNTLWLEKKEWDDFKQYEAEVDDIIKTHKMLALCPYSLDKCGPSEILDVVSNHGFAIIRREDKWELIESSERKKAEEALREAEERYRGLAESINLGITVMDTDYNIVSVSDAICKMFNKDAQSFIGKKCFQEYEKRKEVCPHCPGFKAMQDKKSHSVETRGIRDDGTTFFVRNHAVPILKSDGTIKGFMEIVEDITERKQAEERIKESAEEWQKTFDSMADLIFIQNNDNTILKVNKAFAAAFKMKPEDIVGKKCYELLHKSDRPWPECPFEKTKKSRNAVTQEVDDPNIGIPLLVTTSPIFNDKGELVEAAHIAKDISEIRKTENELKKKISDLERFHKVTVGREMEMVKLKEEINSLLEKSGQPKKYEAPGKIKKSKDK